MGLDMSVGIYEVAIHGNLWGVYEDLWGEYECGIISLGYVNRYDHAQDL